MAGQPAFIIPEEIPTRKERQMSSDSRLQVELHQIGKRCCLDASESHHADNLLSHQQASHTGYRGGFHERPSKRTRLIDYDWKEDVRLDVVRKQVRSVLEKRIRHKFPSEKSQAMTCALEKLLFTRATSLQEYLRLDALDTKLKTVAAALLNRKLKQAEQVNCRCTALVQALGDEKRYQQAVHLVETIKRLRAGQVSPSLSSMSSSTSASKSTSSNKQRVKPLLDFRWTSSSVGATVAPQVKALFFEAELVNIFELTPNNELHNVCWDQLLTKAEEIIEDFANWTSSSLSHCPS